MAGSAQKNLSSLNTLSLYRITGKPKLLNLAAVITSGKSRTIADAMGAEVTAPLNSLVPIIPCNLTRYI